MALASLPRPARTRQALLGAGRRLFATHPFDAVAIDDIVGAAQVAKGSFYNHFADKDALLAAVVADIRAHVEARVAEVNADIADPAERLVRAICVYVRSVADDAATGAILLRNDPHRAGSEPLNQGLREDLAAGIRTGRFTMPTLEGGRSFVMGTAHSLLFSTVRHADAFPPRAQASQLCALLLRAFGVAEAEAATIAGAAADAIVGDDQA